MPNTLPPAGKEQQQLAAAADGDALCRHGHRGWLPSQAGGVRGFHTPRMIPLARTPGRYALAAASAEMPHAGSAAAGGMEDAPGPVYSRLRLDIKFYSWSPLGPHLEYLSSCKEPLQVLLLGCRWNYSGSFCLNLSFTQVERPSETQTAHLHLI